jgi:hypothetical protein
MSAEANRDSVNAGRGRDITIRIVEDRHAHDITIKAADLEAGNGVTYTSSAVSEHSHTVTLTPEIISDLNAGGTLTVSSNPDATGHTHEWAIREPVCGRGSP